MAQKQFNSLVIYVRDGFAVPAIVLKSQIDGLGRELLALLYADPVSGPGQVYSGNIVRIARVQYAVLPMIEGATFGWMELGISDNHGQLMADHRDAAANAPTKFNTEMDGLKTATGPAGIALATRGSAPIIPTDQISDAVVHVGAQVGQFDESDLDRKHRLANLAHQSPVLVIPDGAKVEVEAAGSGTGRYGEHDNWTQHGDGTDYPTEGASYGVPTNFAPGTGSDGQPLKPFVPFKESEPVFPSDPTSFDSVQAAKDTAAENERLASERGSTSDNPLPG